MIYCSQVTNKHKPVCMTCRRGVLLRAFSEGELYTQIDYFQFMFNTAKLERKTLNQFVILIIFNY